jgi:hypothetical protein
MGNGNPRGLPGIPSGPGRIKSSSKLEKTNSKSNVSLDEDPPQIVEKKGIVADLSANIDQTYTNASVGAYNTNNNSYLNINANMENDDL